MYTTICLFYKKIVWRPIYVIAGVFSVCNVGIIFACYPVYHNIINSFDFYIINFCIKASLCKNNGIIIKPWNNKIIFYNQVSAVSIVIIIVVIAIITPLPFNIDELLGKIHSILWIYDALKRENLLNLGERLFHYLKHKTTQKENFTDDLLLKKESILKDLYKQYGISSRQIQIIALLKIGLLQKEICDRLNISINTLKTHMRRLFKKCKVENKTELLNIFYCTGISKEISVK